MIYSHGITSALNKVLSNTLKPPFNTILSDASKNVLSFSITTFPDDIIEFAFVYVGIFDS